MRILAVETTATAASCCVTEDGRVCGRFAVNAGLTHSRTLLPMVEQTLAGCGLTPADIDLFAVAAGPGSFTGVRIGVAAVKGLALPADKPCAGVSTLAAMARLWEDIPMTATVCAVMDARCQQVYTALFAVADGAVTRQTPDEAISLEVLRSRLEAINGPVVLVGDGAALCAEAFADLPHVRLAPPALRMQDAVGVAREAAHVQPMPARELLPVYLRVPQAERELRARLAAEQGKQ
ncbi:MAG: tRNA (adenosine(37)-N6)-threonylcarbamoyltransferase complex dimerization subunit type 1 TsaB [Clostridia bacterium]|nr:tRNA (adenosine(37)-N6)-threonylcarbamoyltransferase complex dimerization subunit type 1 TsaB [Clostridia bacterium]